MDTSDKIMLAGAATLLAVFAFTGMQCTQSDHAAKTKQRVACVEHGGSWTADSCILRPAA